MSKKDFARVTSARQATTDAKPADPPGPSPEFRQRVAELEYQNLRQQVANITLQVSRVMAERDATRELATGLQQEIEKLKAEIATLKGGKG